MATFWRIRCLRLSQTSCSLSSYIPHTSMQNICLQGLRIRFEVEEEMGHLMLASSLSWLFQLSCRGERKLQGVPATGSGGGTFNYRLLAFDVWGPFSHPTEKAKIDRQDSCIAASLIHQAYYHEQNITVTHCAVLSGCCLTICTSHFLIEGSGGGSRVVCIWVGCLEAASVTADTSSHTSPRPQLCIWQLGPYSITTAAWNLPCVCFSPGNKEAVATSSDTQQVAKTTSTRQLRAGKPCRLGTPWLSS